MMRRRETTPHPTALIGRAAGSRRSRRVFALALALIATAAPGAAPAEPKMDRVEAPELGRPGPHIIGTIAIELSLPARLRLTANNLAPAQRAVGVRLWYPASTSTTVRAVYRHRMSFADQSSLDVAEQGTAFEGAAVERGKFPLILVSHGFGGWSEHLSRMCEHLATRGYVVASIDHRDLPFRTVPEFQLSFGNVLIDRALDQRAVLEKLIEPEAARSGALAAVDAGRIGLIGYSMGGFGALATAGAEYDPRSRAFAQLPDGARGLLAGVDSGVAARIDALVLIAPWGAQPESRAWTAESLESLRMPALIVAGDQDDVVDYRRGVRWLFDALKRSDRRLLVYREARHNIAGNAVDLGANPSVEAIGYAREPVWRQERINHINQHFITAFFDNVLKGEAAKAKYLDVPTPLASDGDWPVAFGEPNTGAVAGDGQPGYWRGFPRRWATGLELHHLPAANGTGKGD